MDGCRMIFKICLLKKFRRYDFLVLINFIFKYIIFYLKEIDIWIKS